MLNNSRKTSSNGRPGHPAHQLPQVVDQPNGNSSESPRDEQTEQLADLAAYKVFMKRNLAYEAAPTDLLASIQDRIEKIKAAE